ncbi:SymE family type I addiction module toxin [Providencia stuartii]|uniref:SymE family type I addiction module toxin n=1 Tax=Providencia TaxID=586 RepID=UPI00384E2A74
MLHGRLCAEGQKQHPPPAINLKGQWLKEAVFETGFSFTVKILNGCWVLIPDHEDIRAIKQQNQAQQAQIAAFKWKIKALFGGVI